MGEYPDVKRKNVLRALKKISELDGFEVGTGGHHQWVIRHRTWKRPYPIPFKQNKLKGVYIREIVKKIAEATSRSIEEVKKWFI